MDPIEPATLEFDRLRDHLEPFVKSGLVVAGNNNATSNSSAMSHTLSASRGLGSLPSRYGSLMNLAGYSRSRQNPHLQPSAHKDEPDVYAPSQPSSSKLQLENDLLSFTRDLQSIDAIVPLTKRGHKAWIQSRDIS